MAGKKTRSTYKKSRNGKPFSGRQRYSVKPEKPEPVDGEITASTPGTSYDTGTLTQLNPFARIF